MKNAWTEEIGLLRSIVKAQNYNVKQKGIVLDKVIRENDRLTEGLRRLTLAVCSHESMKRRGFEIDLTPEIEAARKLLETIC